jgi:GT2 family glycosyltransferase/glycosyltransferase involved in cell wall biosynthesis
MAPPTPRSVTLRRYMVAATQVAHRRVLDLGPSGPEMSVLAERAGELLALDGSGASGSGANGSGANGSGASASPKGSLGGEGPSANGNLASPDGGTQARGASVACRLQKWPANSFDVVTGLAPVPPTSSALPLREEALDEVLEAIARVLRPRGQLVVMASEEQVARRFSYVRTLLEDEGDGTLVAASTFPFPDAGAVAVGDLSQRLMEIEGSLAMALVRRWRAVVDRCAPTGSRRRAAYHDRVGWPDRSADLNTRRQRQHDARRARPPRRGSAGERGGLPPLATVADPEVSVLLPVHGRWPLTAGCLRSIAQAPTRVRLEVVVVDDASPDETGQRLSHLPELRTVSLAQNVGFLGAVNAGLDVVRGRYVVLLNNDTVVRPGSLDALTETARESPSIGVVGAKLVYPDGRLQEAGGIVWSNGSGHNYGRGDDPEDLRYSFPRDVDYCSGACLLVRREVLEAVGGFDRRYAPAYYEDTDLCFAARELGYRVVYQPNAVVCHLEGASHGTDIEHGVKRFQERNRSLFADKWRQSLTRQHQWDPERLRVASWRTPSGRVLVIDHKLPRPDRDSGSRRMRELLLGLTALGYGVTFVPQDGVLDEPYAHELQSHGIELLRGPAEVEDYVQEVGSALELAILSRPSVAWSDYPIMRFLAPSTTLVYDTVDLHFLRERRRARVDGSADTAHSARYHHDLEMTLTRLFDATWVVSDTDRASLAAENTDARIFVVPNVHREHPPGPPFAHRRGLLFVGSYPHHPNQDAAIRLAREVLPLVHRQVPDVPLYLVGADPPDEVVALTDEHVHVLGWVPDLTDLYRRSRLFVAPLRFGAGMKGKVGESLSYGLPVVTSTIGAEGMGLTQGRDILLGDSIEELATQVIKAYTDPSTWTMLAENGRKLISSRYSPENAIHTLEAVLTELGHPPARSLSSRVAGTVAEPSAMNSA